MIQNKVAHILSKYSPIKIYKKQLLLQFYFRICESVFLQFYRINPTKSDTIVLISQKLYTINKALFRMNLRR